MTTCPNRIVKKVAGIPVYVYTGIVIGSVIFQCVNVCWITLLIVRIWCIRPLSDCNSLIHFKYFLAFVYCICNALLLNSCNLSFLLPLFKEHIRTMNPITYKSHVDKRHTNKNYLFVPNSIWTIPKSLWQCEGVFVIQSTSV